MKRCQRCILDQDFPNITFDSEGICNYCHEWDKNWKDFNYVKAEEELRSIFRWAKKKKRFFDCLIPFSGGRDSSYVAWICKNRYGLKPLLVTFNNLFLSEYGLHNVLKGAEILDCDHLMLGFRPHLLKRFYRTMVLQGGEFCSICACGINYTVITIQKKYNIPLVIWGRSSKVDENSPFDVICSHPLYVRRALLAGGNNPKDIASFLVKRPNEWCLSEKIMAKLTGMDYIQINLPDFLPWKIKDIEKLLKNELDWQTPDPEHDHIDCRFAPVKNYLKNKQIPHFVFKQEKYSQLIRDGQMTRDEALAKLNNLIQREGEVPPELEVFMDFFELEPQDIEKIGEKSHKKFVKLEELSTNKRPLEQLCYALWRHVKEALKLTIR